MPRLPIHKLLKKDLVWLATHKCDAHGHDFLSHYHCFLTEAPDDSPICEKVGFFDIEAADLNAAYGFLLSYCLKELDGPILGRSITPEELESKDLDKKIVKEAIADIKTFDRVIVHWGKDRRYDLPFLRSRALKHEVDFPLYKEILCQDTWDMSKTKLCLRSNGLKSICQFFGISAKNNPIDPDRWIAAIVRHERKALDYILTHNKEDVVSTEAVWKRLINYVAKTKTSI